MAHHLITYGLGASQIILGPSTVTKIIPPASVSRWMFKKLSGGSFAVVGASTTAVGNGYIIGDNEVISVEGPAQFFLASSGMTTTIQLMFGFSDRGI